MTYDANRAWSDAYIPAIKSIVGPHLLSVSTFEQDTQQATDLVVLNAGAVAIACRIRRPGYTQHYGHQFTVRERSRNGGESELAKIKQGFADWMFYGHAATTPGQLAKWWLLSLDAFRFHIKHSRRVIGHDCLANGDGTRFIAFDIPSFPNNPPLVVASG